MDFAYVCVWAACLGSSHEIGPVDRQTALGVPGENVVICEDEVVKQTASHDGISSNLEDATSYSIDGYPDLPVLCLDQGRIDLLDIQKEVKDVAGHHGPGLSPTLGSNVSRADPLQLADDASLMDSVETSPCNSGSHLRRRRESGVP
ncbi:hypothetical protein LTR13_000443 [Exophiala sideris]|uniref:Uncharacterized protein n=1 Tax=Exophiala sideris TaxID=1016849 RepID=A0ABR0JNV0_9EURO|nr:hypothetical protein LTR13_000443 [Exophiala sideris]KAK5067587.1 hypothetical protein LTR69_001576 [Exophiala sideris]KAK5184174.1 hypothetical protein LTR44_003680 [Eurotiomycetes sp. CCFEE 6388]